MTLFLERMEGAAPIHRARMDWWLTAAEREGIILMIVRCFATLESQMEVYKIGREYDPATGLWNVVDAGLVRTRAKPGQSGHNIVTLKGMPASCATDVIPVNQQSKPIWNTPDHVWSKLYALAGKAGLDAYGDPWGRSLAWDKGHFEEPAFEVVLAVMGLKMPQMNPEV